MRRDIKVEYHSMTCLYMHTGIAPPVARVLLHRGARHGGTRFHFMQTAFYQSAGWKDADQVSLSSHCGSQR
jgi:hypothetical protein